MPFFEGGVSKGFKLYSIRPGSLIASCGLLNGDVITAVNGNEVTSPEKALDAYADVKTAGKVTFDVRRGDKTVLLTVELD